VARGEGTQSFESFPDTAEEALARGGQYGPEGYECYCTRPGQHPRSGKSMPWSSLDRMTSFDSFLCVDLIARRSLLLIVGREAATAWMSVSAYQQAQAPKDLHWIEGANPCRRLRPGGIRGARPSQAERVLRDQPNRSSQQGRRCRLTKLDL
jgi:hypothetical protein